MIESIVIFVFKAALSGLSFLRVRRQNLWAN